MAQGVLVAGEISENQISTTTCEVLAAGQALASELGEELVLALLGNDLQSIASEAFKYGVDKVYSVEHPLLQQLQMELHLVALTRLCQEISPSIVLVGRTSIGREMAPRLAFRLGVGLAQDCLEVKIDPQTKNLLANRPIYGGNAIATVICNDTPQVAAIRPKAYEALEPSGSGDTQGEVVPFAVDLDPSMAKVKTVKVVKEEAQGVKLEDARIVVAGGRGLAGPEPFKDLEALAQLLMAGLGASRAVVDSGWVPQTMQIGLTGKTITPDLYITVAISGASQHMAGCSGAKVIVAINKDSEANIFKEARYGVVGDWAKVLPAFTETVRELVKS